VIPVYGHVSIAERAVASVDAHTPPDVPLLVIDDAGPERFSSDRLTRTVTSGRTCELISHSDNHGLVRTVNEAIAATDDRDVVLVNSDVEVLPGWHEALRAAATDGLVASASAVADVAGILTVPALLAYRDLSADERVRGLQRSRDRIPIAVASPVAVGHCTYLARDALAEVGTFDCKFSPGYGEEVDWSLRAARRGWRHVAALHSFVLHQRGTSFGRGLPTWSLQRRHEARLLARYPREWLRLRLSFGRRYATLVAGLAAANVALAEALAVGPDADSPISDQPNDDGPTASALTATSDELRQASPPRPS
jgi:GT2 family glycosyltransferase